MDPSVDNHEIPNCLIDKLRFKSQQEFQDIIRVYMSPGGFMVDFLKTNLCSTEAFIPPDLLNALNDEYMQKFSYSFYDFNDCRSHAIKVCTQFEEKAKKMSPPMYKSSFFVDFSTKPGLPEEIFKRFLNFFSPVIKTIICKTPTFACSNDDDLAMIDKYCGNDLIKLDFFGSTLPHLFRENQFSALKVLHILNIQWRNFPMLPQLETMYVQLCEFDSTWFSQTFPKLTRVYLISNFKLINEMLIEFLAHNPQLEYLTFKIYDTHSILREIPIHVPNLKYLSFSILDDNIINEKYQEDAMHLLNLRELKHLSIKNHDESADNLLEAIAHGDTSIKKLTFDIWTERTIEIIPKLLNIKKIKVFNTNENIFSKSIVISAARELPLDFFWYNEEKIILKENTE